MKYSYKLETVRYIIPRDEWNKYREIMQTDNDTAELLRPNNMNDWHLHLVWYNYVVDSPVHVEFIREYRR